MTAPNVVASAAGAFAELPAVDPFAQKLDPMLAEAYRSTKAGTPEQARALVEAYAKQSGASVNRGQSEFVIGLAYQRRQLYQEASEHFARAVLLLPGFLETYYYQGIALQNLGRLADARRSLAIYAHFQGDEENTAFQQGIVELEDDKIDAAEAFFRKALAIAERKAKSAKEPRAFDADLGRFWTRLGDVMVRRDDITQARVMFAQASKLQPAIPDIWHKLAVACERMGDADGAKQARAEFERASAARASAGGAPR